MMLYYSPAKWRSGWMLLIAASFSANRALFLSGYLYSVLWLFHRKSFSSICIHSSIDSSSFSSSILKSCLGFMTGFFFLGTLSVSLVFFTFFWGSGRAQSSEEDVAWLAWDGGSCWGSSGSWAASSGSGGGSGCFFFAFTLPTPKFFRRGGISSSLWNRCSRLDAAAR